MSAHARLLIEEHGPAAVVTFSDLRILDTPAIREIREEFRTLVEDLGVRQIVVDFDGVEALSSSAVGVLVELRERLRTRGGEVKLTGLSRDIAHLVALTRLDVLFDIHPNRQQALAAFGQT